MNRLMSPVLRVVLRYTHVDLEGVSAELREQRRELRAVQAELELLRGQIRALTTTPERRPPDRSC